MEGEMSQVPVPDEGVGTCDLHSLWQPHERLSHCTNWKPCGGTGKTTPAPASTDNLLGLCRFESHLHYQHSHRYCVDWAPRPATPAVNPSGNQPAAPPDWCQESARACYDTWAEHPCASRSDRVQQWAQIIAYIWNHRPPAPAALAGG